MRTDRNRSERILIAGGGPAGASLAIRLAGSGAQVTLVERARFPRHKLCGEFISPECLDQFRALGVLTDMESAGGDRIEKTVFYAMNGRRAEVPSKWFGDGREAALGLSRAEMDLRLLSRARALGAEVLEGTAVKDLNIENGRVVSAICQSRDRDKTEVEAEVFVDATGRQRVLAGILSRETGSQESRTSTLVGFKAHFEGARVPRGVCEIYFFPGGYGGVNYVENGIANHCFLIDAGTARSFGGNADSILKELIFRNRRANETLGSAERRCKWLAVAVEGFGSTDPAPSENLFTLGDSSAFIDPFTGSGMLMALEGSEVLSSVVIGSNENRQALYRRLHSKRFGRRLRICSLIRRVAFNPAFAGVAVNAASLSSGARRLIASFTRSGLSESSPAD
ncbi:MAG: NAD(P)/FAD-dependent oxidoreductase [Acidobacteria bacterium]|nr:MAG: NAD(P)/FAD-dependent oxidoreductase [Acidobacteriota bacterium]REJ99114.1 MAG: NAD(P)/FAD-dependent oxidoreductase [Acidobacteriota bacterium]REK16165.1 MAG: NAD(P)/FAD-dependent oxidoreductase [Acidobacteriota bacterium]REK43846.1 MAG: NAD(P)/FAD-dependent oxidoreductase [Acidobacteriota bacterium]